MTEEGTFRVASGQIFPGFSEREEWTNNFFFIQAADTQFGLIDHWAGNPEESRVWEKEIILTERAIQIANQMKPKPKFFVVCGDLIDSMPKEKHCQDQIKDFKTVFQKLDMDIPLVCVCGNHDVGNTPTKETISNYRNNFGDDYFSFWITDEFIKQEKWLDEQLKVSKSDKCKHCIVFQHIPWFLNHPDEEDEYFNLSHSVRQRMLLKFREAGVSHIFCGHYHQNSGGFFGSLELVVTSAIGLQLGTDKSGMRIVRVFEKTIDHKYYALEDCPTNVILNEDIPLS